MAVEAPSAEALPGLAVRARLYRCNAAGEVEPAGALRRAALCRVCVRAELHSVSMQGRASGSDCRLLT